MEEGKGEAYASKIDVRCSDRNRIISHKHVLIATGGSATAEMAMRYSTFGHWISRTWLAFMDESQQYGNYHEIAALAAIQQPTLTVFNRDHRQTPGGRPADFSPAQLIVNTYMVTLLMVTDTPLWLCAAYNGSPALVHRHRGPQSLLSCGYTGSTTRGHPRYPLF